MATKGNFEFSERIVIPVKSEPDGEAYQNIVDMTGKVNSVEFEGKPPGTVRLWGVFGDERDPTNDVVFYYRPEGWSVIWDELTQRWETVIAPDTVGPLYDSVDLSFISDLRVDPAAVTP